MARDALGRNCRECGSGPMVARHPGQPGVEHRGRGLCRNCYVRNERAGTLDRYPRSNAPAVDRAQVIREYASLRNEGLTMTEIARRIGISRTALYQALRRDKQCRRRRLSASEVERLRRIVGAA